MYTGIIQGIGKITHLESKPGLTTLVCQMPENTHNNVEIWASIGLNGVCLTVTSFEKQKMRFDLMNETLQKTNLHSLTMGSYVNIERSAKIGDEIGGHQLSGHVYGIAEIIKIETPENNHIITFQVPKEWMQYIQSKWFIALNGASLTIVNSDKNTGTFEVHLIPETLQKTTFGTSQVGDKINVEIDSQTQTIVNTINTFLEDIDWGEKIQISEITKYIN